MTPEKLGKYEIRGTLGQGAMGLVYDGWDPLILRRVAIKTVALVQGDDADAAEGVERFRREAQAAGRLQHPNIVSVFDFGETETLAYIVMEFMDGGTLKDVLDREKKLPPAQAVDMMCQVLSALAYSHARGVVHRDVKPANIMLDHHGAVKLGDFGIARIESSSMTLVGDVLGTPAYMAPEQFLGESADARADIFAAGATLFHLLTGSRPYEGSRTTVRQKVLTATVAPSATERAPEVPAALDAVLQRAMARQAADRFEGAADFAAAVKASLAAPVLKSSGDEATVFVRGPRGDATLATAPRQPLADVSRPATGKRRGTLVAAFTGIAALLAVGGGSAWYFTHTGPAAPPIGPVGAPKPASQATGPAQQPDPTAAKLAAQAMAKLVTSHDVMRVENVTINQDCALAHAVSEHVAIGVAGLVGAGAAEAALRNAVKQAASIHDVNWSLQTFDGPYCIGINAIRSAWQRHAIDLALQNPNDAGLAAPATVLRNNMFMKPVISGVEFDAYLRVDDLQSNGTVVHMYPQITGNGFHADPARPLPAGSTLVLGVPPHNQFQVGEPFGTDMIIAVASRTPLLSANRPNIENAAKYLADLKQAIVSPGATGELAAGAMPVETQP